MSTYKEVVEFNLPAHLEEHVIALEEAWGLKPRHRISAAKAAAIQAAKARRKQGVPPAPSPVPSTAWTPCMHWGGVRECPCCSSKVQEGYMKRAQALYEEHSRYVHLRVQKELRIARREQDLKDVEQKVWEKVAVRIDRFEVKGTTKVIRERNTKAWLKDVGHSVVMDYLDSIFAQRRDVRQEVELVETDKGVPDTQDHDDVACNVPAKSTPTADTVNGLKEDSTEYLNSISEVTPLI